MNFMNRDSEISLVKGFTLGFFTTNFFFLTGFCLVSNIPKKYIQHQPTNSGHGDTFGVVGC